MTPKEEQSFGVFKPVGHVVISFPTADQAAQAVQALLQLGVTDGNIRRYSDQRMIQQIDQDLERASPLAAIGQEINLLRAQRELAEQGYHFLVVHAPDNDLAAEVARAAQLCGAERAQSYGKFIIEELIERPGDEPQVSESPDRGLDAQTPSGEETEAAQLEPHLPGQRPIPKP